MKRPSLSDPIEPLHIDIEDRIRGIALALRHWFSVEDVEVIQRRAGLLPPKSGKSERYDKSFRVLTVSALPPQIVRLKPDAPMTTLHFMQDVYDDGTLRADPWRWWFAWIAIELIARAGPDVDGSITARFVREDPSVETVRFLAPRWLAANPTRLMFIESHQHDVLSRALDTTVTAETTGGGRTLSERVLAASTHLNLGFVQAMSGEAGRLAASITLRLRERAERQV